MKEQIVVDSLLTSFERLPGTNGNCVIFLHGWASSKEVWGRALIDVNKIGFTAISLDLPGFGGTSGPKSVWGVGEYAQFVTHFLDKLHIDSCVVVGHSFGGRLALVLAANNTSRVTKMALVNSAGIRMFSKTKEFLGLISKVVKPLFRLRWINPLRKKIYKMLAAEDYVATPELNATFVKVIEEDLTHLLPKITCPTLIFWGERDVVTPLSFANQFKVGIKNSKLVVAPQVGHYSFMDMPDLFSRSLTDFLRL